MSDLLEKISEINKKFKKDVVTSGEGYLSERVPTGSFSLDTALGGGWPVGRQVLVWGNYSSTKSALALWTIREAQKAGKSCMLIDTENSFDSAWAKDNGVDIDALYLSRLKAYEEILEVTKPLLQDALVDVLVIDSISGMNTNKFFEDGSNALGLHARSVGEVMTKFNKWNENALILHVSQTRTKFRPTGGGQNIAYTGYMGGAAVDFYSSVIVNLFAGNSEDDRIKGEEELGNMIYENVVGRKIRWQITKSKISVPQQEGKYYFHYSGGNDYITEVVDMAVQYGIIEKGGAWFKYGDQSLQGAKKMRDYLASNLQEVDKLKDEVLAKATGR